jgi:hypothetical protein
MKSGLCFLMLLACSTVLIAAAEPRRPVSAKIIPTKEQAEGPHGSESGNVQVTFSDGTKEMWTKKSHCQFPQVSSDGSLVGWSHGEILKVQSSSMGGEFLGSNKLRIMRGEKVAADFTVDTPIRRWVFSPDLKFVYILDQGLHGPETISRGEISTGKIVERHNSMDENLPAWAKPLAE